MSGKERILATIDGRQPDRLGYMPITMMFAADRIGVPYREYATDYRKLVEGWIEGPMAEAADLRGINTLMLDFYDDPEFVLPFEKKLIDGMHAMGARARLHIVGDINPVEVLRNGTPEGIHAALTECHAQAGSRYVVGAGCEVPRDTSHDNLNAMRDFARSRTA